MSNDKFTIRNGELQGVWLVDNYQVTSDHNGGPLEYEMFARRLTKTLPTGTENTRGIKKADILELIQRCCLHGYNRGKGDFPLIKTEYEKLYEIWKDTL